MRRTSLRSLPLPWMKPFSLVSTPYQVAVQRRKETIDPLSGRDIGGLVKYHLARSEALSELKGRLTVEWGAGKRSWVQRAERQEKPIREIRPSAIEPPFPGLLDFEVRLSELSGVPATWRAVLSAVGGVYLLTHPESGDRYVGAAYGQRGFWGRWEAYIATGHGGNRGMMEIPPADYHVTILEVAQSSAQIEDVVNLEVRWKKKIQSKRFGLNRN